MANITVSSGDFLKAYGRISEAALREPVSINDRERLAPLSADEHRRLKRNNPLALYPWELTDSGLRALADSDAPPEAAAFDHERDC